MRRAWHVTVWSLLALMLWGTMTGSTRARQATCDRQLHLETWLQVQAATWDKVLLPQIGYEQPENVIVCRAAAGRSYADYEHNRIYLRVVDAEEDQIALAHEYLHLAFKHHPRAYDERFIEQTARELLQHEGHPYAAGN